MGSALISTPGSEQIAAAARLWSRSAELVRTERALFALQGYFPGLDGEAVLLKFVALQALDTGRMFGLERWAAHTERLLAGVDPRSVEFDIVERLADVPGISARERKGAVTVASRFAHYFLDVDRFPVFDTWSELELARLDATPNPSSSRYVRFATRLASVATELGIGRPRRLWSYLWLAGQLRAWRRSRRRSIHRAARTLFETHASELDLLLPPGEPALARQAA